MKRIQVFLLATWLVVLLAAGIVRSQPSGTAIDVTGSFREGTLVVKWYDDGNPIYKGYRIEYGFARGFEAKPSDFASVQVPAGTKKQVEIPVEGEYDFALVRVHLLGADGKELARSNEEMIRLSSPSLSSSTLGQLNLTLNSFSSSNFPFLYSQVTVDTSGVAVVNLPESAFRAFENGVLQTDFFQVTPPATGGGVRIADIIFVMDNSGSMDDIQAAVVNNVRQFVDSLVSRGIDMRLGLVRFGQYDNGQYGYSGSPIVEDNGVTTSDVNYFKNTVLARNVSDGWFEPGFHALVAAAQRFSFRPGAQKIFILTTDEDNDIGPSPYNYTLSQTVSVLTSAPAIVYGLVDQFWGTSYTDYVGPGSVTQATGGRAFQIRQDQVTTMLNYINFQAAAQYTVRYRSSDPVFNGTTRLVKIIVNAFGQADTVETSYVPGAAPIIQRTPATIALHNQPWAEGTSFTIEADITDNVPPLVQSARLYYRRTGVATYSSVAMTRQTGDRYRGIIPGSAVQTPGLDYYITATDGQTTSSDPRTDPANNPYQFGILPNVAPVVTHTPVTTLTPGNPITITANIVDNTNSLSAARLYYRKTGQLLYQQATMTSTGGNNYQAVIPASYVTTDGVDYYIYAVDNFGVSSTHATSDLPHVIAFLPSKIKLSNIHVRRQSESQFNPYPPTLSLGIRRGDEVRFEGIIRDGLGNPIANQQITAYDPLLYDPQVGSNGKRTIVSGSDGKFFYPSTGSVSLATVPPGVLVYWFKIATEGEAIPFCLVVNDPSLTVRAVNQTLRQLTSRNRSILDIRVDTSARSPFRELYVPAEAYPRNDDNLNAATNDGFFRFLAIVYTGPTDESFLIGNNYSSGWLKRGFDLYQNAIVDVARNLPERFELIIPPRALSGLSKGTGLEDYDPTETGNLILYGVEGLVCASTLIPTGVTQAIGPVGCFALKVHLATDAIKTVATSDELQRPFGAAGNDELDAGIELVVDIGALLYSANDMPKHVARVQNPRNFMHGAPGRLRSAAEIADFAKDLGQTSATSWDYGYMIGSHYRNPTGHYKGSSFSNIGFMPPSGSYTRADLNFNFTRANKPSLNFTDVRWDNPQTPSYLHITVQSSRPTFRPTTTTQIVPDLRIGASNFTLQNITQPNTAPFLYRAQIPVSQLPNYNPANPGAWSEPIYCTGSNFETRWSNCTGGFCGANGNSLYLTNGAQSSQSNTSVAGDTMAVLRVPPNAFGNQSLFVTITSSSFNSVAGRYQNNLVAHSDAIQINAEVSSFILPSELRLSFSSSIPIQNVSRVGIYKFIPDEVYWEKVQSNVSIVDSMAIAFVCTTGIYAVLEEVSDVSGPPTNGRLTNQNVYFFPNPFNPDHQMGLLRYSLAQNGNVVAKIYDISNTLVKILEDGFVIAETEEAIAWDGRNERGDIVGNGVYFYVIESSSGERAVGKIAVLR